MDTRFSPEVQMRRQKRRVSLGYAGIGIFVIVVIQLIAPFADKDFSSLTKLKSTDDVASLVKGPMLPSKQVSSATPKTATSTAKPTASKTSAAQTPAVIQPAQDVNLPVRDKIVSTANRELAKKPVAYDRTVLIYTEGNREAWCADFISYVYDQSGKTLSNPTSGSWRIASVSGMRAYFTSQGRYHSVYGYEPKPGDVAIYGTSHTNIVVAVDADTITTIGGNEYNSVYKDTISRAPGTRGLVGYGSPD